MTGQRDPARRVILVTGAGSGIGRALAIAFAEADTDVILVGRRSAELQASAAMVEYAGGRPVVAAADLASDDAVAELRSMVEQVGDGVLHLLVHAAAAHISGTIDDTSTEDLDATIRVNLRAPMILTRQFLPMLRAAPGDVVFVNSSAALSSPPSSAVYAASKAALRSVADSLRQHVSRDGIRVMSVFPGRTATDLQEAIHRQEGRAYRPDLLLQPPDVAAAVVSLLRLPRTAEVTEVHLRPAIKSY